MHDTLPLLGPTSFPVPRRKSLDTLQINIGLRCNLACLHCHVNSNPYRKEKMSTETLNLVQEFLKRKQVNTLDITGGAPEMHDGFKDLVEKATEMKLHVIDRCNLTILQELGYGDMHHFLAKNNVEIIASLPCYTKENVDQQRGNGVFADSIAALQKLNAIGYGMQETGLVLNLVYNPLGPSLPPSQLELEQTYKSRLLEDFGIEFNQLFTLCNMPINRFGSTLVSKGQFNNYISLLKEAHRDENLDSIMCRNLISVDWEGYVYDCDFNQMLGLNMNRNGKTKTHLSDLLNDNLQGQEIAVRNHCYGCTAGQGSSCGGALN